MPFLTSVRRALPAVTLLIATAFSQTCYYPDGETVSSDVPCSSNGTASACCPSDSFCSDNGLCYGGGLVTRSSCTDKTWGSAACAGYCKTETPDAAIAITPCSQGNTDTFACGSNTTDCQTGSNTFTVTGGSGLQLRTDQVASLLSSVLSSEPSSTATAAQVTVTVTPSSMPSTTEYSGAQMAGLGCGLGLPLFFALCAALILLRRERQKHARPKLMYKLPDDCKDEFTFRPPPSAGRAAPSYSPNASHADSQSLATSRRTSFRTVGSQKLGHLPGFLERYETMKQKGQVHEKERHELDSSDVKDIPRHELGEGRVSR